MVITYDFGHGTGQDRGAEGYRNEEHDCREYGALVIQKLQKLGHTCYNCTPTTAGLTLMQSLGYRVNKANSYGSQLHLCFHVNAYETDKATGCEVEYISSAGENYADKICSEISSALGLRNRGSQERPNLYVLKYTSMCAVLIEPYFCDNNSDCSKYNADKLATAIVKAITGQTVSGTTTTPIKKVIKYDESIPEGVINIPKTKGYIEPRKDGSIGIHYDRGTYIVLGKGVISMYWNDNNGNSGSKKLSD